MPVAKAYRRAPDAPDEKEEHDAEDHLHARDGGQGWVHEEVLGLLFELVDACCLVWLPVGLLGDPHQYIFPIDDLGSEVPDRVCWVHASGCSYFKPWTRMKDSKFLMVKPMRVDKPVANWSLYRSPVKCPFL